VKNFPSRGIWQLSGAPAGLPSGATNIGTPQDSYASGPDFLELNLGNWSPASTSDKWFKFAVTGKNASSTGYTEAFDYVALIPH
jgi:hypothetical protein